MESPKKSANQLSSSVVSATTSKKRVTNAKKHPEINKAVAEKGWISVTSKMDTQNYHIKKMQSHHMTITNVRF